MVQSVESKVRDILAIENGLDPDEISGSDRLDEDLGLDSLDHAEFIMGLEQEFKIGVIPEDDADEIQTVQQAVAYVEKSLDHNQRNADQLSAAATHRD